MAISPQKKRGSSGLEAARLADECGLTLDDWQAADLVDAMAETTSGTWAASEVDLICARQNGKNCVVEARELAGMVMFGESIIHTAHLFPTARESFHRLMALVEGHADVKKRMTYHVASVVSGFEMRFVGGGRIRFIARTRTSGRGLTGDVLVFDEAQDLIDDSQGALLPTISARPNSQVWYLGSAPELGSTVAHRFRARGRSLRPGPICYREYSAAPDANLDDRQAWAIANPGYPHRISDRAIESERAQMDDTKFARERLSISPDPLEVGGPFGPAWAEVCDPDVMVSEPDVFGLDVNPERSFAGIVGVGQGVVSVAEYRPGTSWLVGRAKELREKYRVPFALDRQGPAGTFADELRRQHMRLIDLDNQEMVRAAGHFYDQVTARAVKVRTNEDLDRAVSGAAKRASGDAFAWGRKSSATDICLLVAATAGLWAAGRVSRGPNLWNVNDLLEQGPD